VRLGFEASRRTAAIAMLLGLLIAGCLAPAVNQSPAAVGSPVATSWKPPDQPLPSDPAYRERLGEYADLVLGSAMVPPGSPEHVAYLVRCIESSGFDVEATDDGITGNLGAQETEFRAVMAACEQAAVDVGLVKAVEAPDARALGAQYDAFQLTYECMLEHGYPVGDPPSKDAYVEAGGQNWHPYDVAGQSPTTMDQIETDCPADLVMLFEKLASGERP
jgi:hypothetical protein